MKLSIIMPVYNEKNTILKILDKVKNVKLKKIEKEIIIVDDFSTDGTRDVLKEINETNIKIFFHKKNFGKGAAIKTALPHVTGDLVIIQDADLEYDPQDYKKLINCLKKKKSDVVYGVRSSNKKSYYRFYLGNKFLTLLTTLLYNKKMKDMETCYKLFRSKILKKININANGFDFEPEITAKILKKKKIKIYQIPISYNPRSVEEGKKIKIKDGLIAIWTLIKYRFTD